VAQVFLSAQLEPQQLFLFFPFPKTNQLIQKHKKWGLSIDQSVDIPTVLLNHGCGKKSVDKGSCVGKVEA